MSQPCARERSLDLGLKEAMDNGQTRFNRTIKLNRHPCIMISVLPAVFYRMVHE